MEEIKKINWEDFVLYGKWGMDGASGQQNFKQRWSINNDKDNDPFYLNDSTVFIISYVPLVLSSDNNILWKNDRPSSVRYCRPIKFEFFKETSSNTLREYEFYVNKIDNLQPTIVVEDHKTIKVTHKLQCTMIDGKICNVLTNQKSSTSCNICGATPKQMNDLKIVNELKCNEDNYKFGLSTLHCWIRFMECILHISYNMDFKEGFARGNNKILKQNKKKQIQNNLKSQLSITVDIVKQGYGTTNDGNTARRFFAHPETVSNLTGIDQTLIERFANILHVMASGREIDSDKFEKYAYETAELFIRLYPWYNMPPSVHKVLIHGSAIMKKMIFPIGCLSEEAQEAGNKIFKAARAHNSRRCSRIANNEDIIHTLLISSDPVISKLRISKNKKMKDLTEEAKNLLIDEQHSNVAIDTIDVEIDKDKCSMELDSDSDESLL